MVIWGKKEIGKDRDSVLTDYGKKKLLTYADSFQELAESLVVTYDGVGGNRQEILDRKRNYQKQEVICKNMTEVSKILTDMASEVFRARPLPERQYKKIVQLLRGERLQVTDLFYLYDTEEAESEGRLTLGVRMRTDKAGGIRTREVSDMLSVILDERLIPAPTADYLVEREEKYFFFVKEPVFMVMPGYAKAIREGERMSGDNHSLIESVDGKLTVLLSDGMGSGEKAARDSEKVLDLMEKMIEAGYNIPTAMGLVNSALEACEEENMSTLDVCSMDLYSGMCRFLKAGAATTFLKSHAYVEKISMNTLPLGILQENGSEGIERELIENDYIIMVTDGVTDALAMSGYEDMLCSYLGDLPDRNPEAIASKVLQFALRHSSGRITDDMTVVVLGIFRAR